MRQVPVPVKNSNSFSYTQHGVASLAGKGAALAQACKVVKLDLALPPGGALGQGNPQTRSKLLPQINERGFGKGSFASDNPKGRRSLNQASFHSNPRRQGTSAAGGSAAPAVERSGHGI